METNQGGAYVWNETAVKDHTETDNDDGTATYTVTINEVIDGYVTITPIETEIVITANSASKIYDGTPLTNNGFTFTEDDITIYRSDVGTLTKGTNVNDGNFVPVYENKGGKTVLTGWTFKMPQGGVYVEINFRQIDSFGIDLTIKDQNGNVLNGKGYVTVQYNGSYFTDLSTDFGKVPYGSAVAVALTDLGSSLYELSKVTVEGVTCYDNGGHYQCCGQWCSYQACSPQPE